MIIGRERNDVGRPGDAGYPVRGIIEDGYLFLSNSNPERWPAGNPETGYLDCDGSPTKTFILTMRRAGISLDYWKLNFGKRSDEELYDLGKDPECMNNLAGNAAYNPMKRKLHDQLYLDLLEQDDPRAYGKGDLFDRYPYADESSKKLLYKVHERRADAEKCRRGSIRRISRVRGSDNSLCIAHVIAPFPTYWPIAPQRSLTWIAPLPPYNVEFCPLPP